MQEPWRAGEICLRARDSLREAGGPGIVGYVGEALGEVAPFGAGWAAAGEAFARLEGKVAELLLVQVLERCADDAALGQQPGPGEMEDAGEKLALGEVARDAEDHEHVRRQRRDGLRAGVGR